MTARIDDAGSQTVSVVIPTTGRTTLIQAIESALAQSHPPHEILVVCDLAEQPPVLEARMLPGSIRVLLTGGGQGSSAARQLGIEQATGSLIALLDDDDYWYQHKLAAQLATYRSLAGGGHRPVVSAAMDVVTPEGDLLYRVPRRSFREGQSVTDYLFKRRELRYGEASIASSTLLFERTLGLDIPFRADLSLHEDWDWVIRAGARADTVFAIAERGPHLAYRVQPLGKSLSRAMRWRVSLAWLEENRSAFTPREYGDFLLGVTLGMAVDRGARREALRIAARAFCRGRPGLPAMLVGIATLLLPRGGAGTLTQLPRRVSARMTRRA